MENHEITQEEEEEFEPMLCGINREEFDTSYISRALGTIYTIRKCMSPQILSIEIEPPPCAVSPRTKLVYTGSCLAILMVLGRLPLYGVKLLSDTDPLQGFRMLHHSERGTLLELALTSMFMSQMPIVLGIVPPKLVNNKIYKRCFKLFLTTLLQVTALVARGSFLGFSSASLVCIQIIGCTIVISSLDELANQGYGISPPASLLSGVHLCEQLTWSMLSPRTVGVSKGVWLFEGFLLQFFYAFKTPKKSAALYSVFTHPNLWRFLKSVVFMGIAIFISSFQMVLVLTRGQGLRVPFPIKLFYTSVTPLSYLSLIYMYIHEVPLKLMRGVLGEEHIAYKRASGVYTYLATPPTTWGWIHMLTYVFTTLGACVLLSKACASASGSSADNLAAEFEKHNVTLVGGNLRRRLNKYIPTAILLGGFLLGVLKIIGDLMGVVGMGGSSLIAIDAISQTAQKMASYEYYYKA